MSKLYRCLLAFCFFCAFALPASATYDEDVSAFFAWAQKSYPDYFSGSYQSGTYQQYVYRFYPKSSSYLAVANYGIYVYGDLTDGELTYITSLQSVMCSIYAPNCAATGSTGGSSQYALSGSIHTALKGWGVASYTGTVDYATHNKDGSRGAVINHSSDPCTVGIDSGGNLFWLDAGGSLLTWKYEGNYGGTNTDQAVTLRLYAGKDGQANPDSFVEFTRSAGLRWVTSNSSALEMSCVIGLSTADSTRFPKLDGRLGSYSGTYRSIAPVEAISVPAGSSLVGASCSAVINSAGQVTVNLGGNTLPVLFTTDLNLDQSRISTMFSSNPLLNPQTTYALQYTTAAFNGQFILYAPPLTYYDSASPSFSSPTMLACRTAKQ